MALLRIRIRLDPKYFPDLDPIRLSTVVVQNLIKIINYWDLIFYVKFLNKNDLCKDFEILKKVIAKHLKPNYYFTFKLT